VLGLAEQCGHGKMRQMSPRMFCQYKDKMRQMRQLKKGGNIVSFPLNTCLIFVLLDK